MTNAERQARFREQQRERGLIQVNEWVPEDRKDELREIARMMREEKDVLTMHTLGGRRE